MGQSVVQPPAPLPRLFLRSQQVQAPQVQLREHESSRWSQSHDAIQSYTFDVVNQFREHRKNPNGCPLKMTYFTSLTYTNCTLVTDWYVAGNEIADHTMTHVGNPPATEINGNIIALNALAGIPMHAIKDFRAPFLNYTSETFHFLAVADFMYDSSTAASIPVTDPDTDAYWPYTLDYGLANNCLTVQGICQGQPQLPGIWEMPMYAFFDERGVNGPHLIDAWLDPANGASTVNDTATLEYMMNTFIAHYNGTANLLHCTCTLSISPYAFDVPWCRCTHFNHQRDQQVFGLASGAIRRMDRVQRTIARLGPEPHLNSFDPLKCPTPDINPTMHICNGIPANEQGLLNECAFPDFPFYTCVSLVSRRFSVTGRTTDHGHGHDHDQCGCPQVEPSPANPNPPQQVPEVATNCSTPFWDPVAGVCLCTSDECAF
ncbi:hypothetical protein JVT61DRAFT_5024 [Boletus reticuloceps]|uniref:Uncharacterized protein n=1 Tax=Boletus reticuloceps TaxID=495285 RepID=A0A8I2YZ72_9AGAM|nr:hypothetical protein JVT61DRAFT_5024 [Boletus reticuloceps]